MPHPNPTATLCPPAAAALADAGLHSASLAMRGWLPWGTGPDERRDELRRWLAWTAGALEVASTHGLASESALALAYDELETELYGDGS